MSYELSDEDKKRISYNRDYKWAKRVYESHNNYREVSVGEVYKIKRLNYKDLFVCNYGKAHTKFYIISKDDGFVFAKRISSNGKLGKQVICLTVDYPLGSDYELVPDDAYVESMLLDTEYDFSKEGKSMMKRKNKARAHNKKLFVTKYTPKDAKDFIDSLSVGDFLWDSHTKFGEGLAEWQVIDIEKRKTDQTFAQPRHTWETAHKFRGATPQDRAHNQYNFSNTTIVTIKPRPLDGKRRSAQAKNIIFTDFLNTEKWYISRPKTPEDFDV